MIRFTNCYSVSFQRTGNGTSELPTYAVRWLYRELSDFKTPLAIHYLPEEGIFHALYKKLEEALNVARYLDAVLPPMDNNCQLAHDSGFGGHNVSVLDLEFYEPESKTIMFNQTQPLYLSEEPQKIPHEI
jgi:hypothetical protein